MDSRLKRGELISHGRLNVNTGGINTRVTLHMIKRFNKKSITSGSTRETKVENRMIVGGNSVKTGSVYNIWK